VQNVKGDAWLVRWPQRLSEHEHIDVALTVPKSAAAPLGEVQALLMDRLLEYVGKQRDKLRRNS
jgi:hypothetical protein